MPKGPRSGPVYGGKGSSGKDDSRPPKKTPIKRDDGSLAQLQERIQIPKAPREQTPEEIRAAQQRLDDFPRKYGGDSGLSNKQREEAYKGARSQLTPEEIAHHEALQRAYGAEKDKMNAGLRQTNENLARHMQRQRNTYSEEDLAQRAQKSRLEDPITGEPLPHDSRTARRGFKDTRQAYEHGKSHSQGRVLALVGDDPQQGDPLAYHSTSQRTAHTKYAQQSIRQAGDIGKTKEYLGKNIDKDSPSYRHRSSPSSQSRSASEENKDPNKPTGKGKGRLAELPPSDVALEREREQRIRDVEKGRERQEKNRSDSPDSRQGKSSSRQPLEPSSRIPRQPGYESWTALPPSRKSQYEGSGPLLDSYRPDDRQLRDPRSARERDPRGQHRSTTDPYDERVLPAGPREERRGDRRERHRDERADDPDRDRERRHERRREERADDPDRDRERRHERRREERADDHDRDRERRHERRREDRTDDDPYGDEYDQYGRRYDNVYTRR